MPGLAIFGVTGRMGQALVRSLVAGPGSESVFGLTLSGAICARGSVRSGADAAIDAAPSGILVTSDAAAGLLGAAVAVDFSHAQRVQEHAAACAHAGVPLLVGTTGLDAQARAGLEKAARAVPVLIAPNTSLGIALMMQMVRLATAVLGTEFDVEIMEAHHRLKRDAPSGTALALGEVVAQARGADLADLAVFDRHGAVAPRTAGSIGFAVLRAADIIGEHTVVFAAAGERIEITHRATDRATFARGALRAAAWLEGRPAGLYGMQDVLGLP